MFSFVHILLLITIESWNLYFFKVNKKNKNIVILIRLLFPSRISQYFIFSLFYHLDTSLIENTDFYKQLNKTLKIFTEYKNIFSLQFDILNRFFLISIASERRTYTFFVNSDLPKSGQSSMKDIDRSRTQPPFILPYNVKCVSLSSSSSSSCLLDSNRLKLYLISLFNRRLSFIGDQNSLLSFPGVFVYGVPLKFIFYSLSYNL